MLCHLYNYGASNDIIYSKWFTFKAKVAGNLSHADTSALEILV